MLLAQETTDRKSLQDLEQRLRERPSDSRENDVRGMRLDRTVRDKPIENLESPKPEATTKPEGTTKSDGTAKPEATTKPESSTKSVAPAVREVLPSSELDAQAMGQLLQLSDVMASTYRAFPLLEIARLQSGVTAGQQTSAMGAYDVKLEYYSLNQPVGFYETYRNGIGVARQLWWGGYASAGYRIGRGNFEPWYKERQTNDGGEFKVAFVQPLLQGRAIDPSRVELFQSNLRRQSVGPEIQSQILVAGLDAAKAFWLWVEIGNVLKAQERMLEIAVKRGEQLERSKAAGAASNLEISLNAQQIYDRQLKVNETRQKFRDTAFKLSLFLRDESGGPLLAPPEWLPSEFPEIAKVPVGDFDADFQKALGSRPELTLIELDRQSSCWDLTLARNQLLPNVDFSVQTIQNVGQGTSAINDKGEFQVEAGVIGGVPVQRRKPIGKIQSTEAKLMQISQKLEYQRNKIGIELRIARNALDIAQQNVVAAKELVKQANIALSIFRRSLEAGRTDLFFLLTQEIKVNDSEVKLLEAERDFFTALASMQAALGLDPLEQATGLTIQ